MPYSSGTYTAPSNSWNPALPATTISAADWNSQLADYETAWSTCILKDGTQTLTANIPFSGFKATGVNTNSGNGSRSEFVSGATLQDGGPLDSGLTAGSSTVYTATLSPAITAYADKQCFRVQFDEACGNNPTINFNSVGAKKIYKNVSGVATQLVANDVTANFVAILRYDDTLDTAAGGFWLINSAPIAPGSITSAMLADQTYIDFTEGAAPSTPAASTVVIYAKSDGLMYSKDDAGTESLMSLNQTVSTWTPVLTFATPGNLSVTYAVQVGTYIKTGKMVTVQFRISTSSFTHTSASGNLLITGLPFASNSVTNSNTVGALRWNGITKASYTDLVSFMNAAESQFRVSASGSGVGSANVDAADMPTGGTVSLFGTHTYWTD